MLLEIYMNMIKNLQRVLLKVSTHWFYLHQDAVIIYSEIYLLKKMKLNWKYSKATICRNMKKNICKSTNQLVVKLQNKNQERQPKLSVQQSKKNLTTN